MSRRCRTASTSPRSSAFLLSVVLFLSLFAHPLAAQFPPPPPGPSAEVAEVRVEATGPHAADGIATSQVTIALLDAAGNPVAGGPVEVEISQPFFTKQLHHDVRHLQASPSGFGQFSLGFTSKTAGTFEVIALDRASGASGRAIVEFESPSASNPISARPRGLWVDPDGRNGRGGRRSARPFDNVVGQADAPEVANCKKFFDELDDIFYPPFLKKKIEDPATPAAEKMELEMRLKALMDVMAIVAKDIKAEEDAAREKPVMRMNLTAAEKAALLMMINAKKAEFMKISDLQRKLMEKYFGKPIKPDDFQKCTELFNNFKLVDNFEKAIENIRKRKPAPGEDRIVPRGPDASIAHIRWVKFAKLAVMAGIDADFWEVLAPSLGKGSAITVCVLSDNDPVKPGIQAAMVAEADLKKKRMEYDPLRPAPTDTPAQKQQKCDDLEKKLIGLIKKINVEKTTIAMLPVEPGSGTVVVTVSTPVCDPGVVTKPSLGGAISLDRLGDMLMGFGVDLDGRAYSTVGNVDGSTVRFAVTGRGLSPTDGPAITAFEGVLVGNQVTGTVEGKAFASEEGSYGPYCTWEGSFTLGVDWIGDGVEIGVCGNGVVEAGEVCDDGNLFDGDGCSASCAFDETPFPAACGNGVLEAGELCDDGNLDPFDACSNDCTLEIAESRVCGNGILEPGELCDDGNLDEFDGCTKACTTAILAEPLRDERR